MQGDLFFLPAGRNEFIQRPSALEDMVESLDADTTFLGARFQQMKNLSSLAKSFLDREHRGPFVTVPSCAVNHHFPSLDELETRPFSRRSNQAS